MSRAVRYRAANNQELVEHLIRKGVIKSQRIVDVMIKVDRKKYVDNHNDAYSDSAQNIGNGRSLSAPHTVAVVLESLNSQLREGNKVLIIRCSSGYLTACMAQLVGHTGRVVHVDSNPDVQNKVIANINNDDPKLLAHNRIRFILDNEKNGYIGRSRYDVIYIGAAVFEVPKKIIQQLHIEGTMLVPMIKSKSDADSQILTLFKKDLFSDKIVKIALCPVRYELLNEKKRNNNYHSSEVKLQLLTAKQDTDNVAKIKENIDTLKSEFSKLEDTVTKTHNETSAYLKQSNQTIIHTIQKKYPTLDSELDAIRNTLKNNFSKLEGTITKTHNETSSYLQQLNQTIIQVIEKKYSTVDNEMMENTLQNNFSKLEDTVTKTHNETSSYLKESNQTILQAIEKKYSNLDGETDAMRNALEQKITEHCAFMRNISKQFELNLLKFNRRRNSAIIKKNLKILQGQSCKKIDKVERVTEDKINVGGRLLLNEVSVFKATIEDKLARENAAFREEISGELKKRDSILWSKFKKELLSLRDMEKTDSECNSVTANRDYRSSIFVLTACAIVTFGEIITLHALVVIYVIWF